MNVDECRRVLRELEASFIVKLTDERVVVWTDTLASLDVDDALGAVRLLRRTSDRFPTHSQFLAAAHAAARRRSTRTPQLPQEALPTLSELEQRRQAARRGIAEARAKLRGAQAS